MLAGDRQEDAVAQSAKRKAQSAKGKGQRAAGGIAKRRAQGPKWEAEVFCSLLLVFGSGFFVRGCWFRAKGEGSEPFETYWDGWGLRPGGSYWSASVITGIGLGQRPEKAGGTDRLWSLAPGGGERAKRGGRIN